MQEGEAYRRLLDKVAAKVGEVGRIFYEELLKWAGEEGIGEYTLRVILQDLLDEGRVKAPEGFYEAESILLPPAPKVVEYAKTEKEKVKVEEAAEELIKEREVHEVEEAVEQPPLEEEKRKETITPAVLEAEVSDELEKAVEYLSSYWSVGVLRFLSDLKKMGVEDPQQVLVKLKERGFIEVVEPGVVNATDKLPRIRKPRLLAEFTI